MRPPQAEAVSLTEAAQVLDEVQAKPRRLKPYAKYKDSGVDWLGDIPEHWEARKIKFLSDIRTSNVDKKSDENEQEVLLCNYTDVYYNDYIKADMEFMKATASPEEIRRFKLEQNDVLITKDSEMWDDIAVPALVDDKMEGVLCGYHLAQIRPNKEVCGEYLFRAFYAHAIRDQFRVRANGITRFGLSCDGVTSAIFSVPTLNEQKAIAAFLRKETTKIDSLVAKKQRLIELLRRKRTALISKAVTKGLNPNVKMKPSGIDWLGNIPEHWGVKPIKYVVGINPEDLSQSTDSDFEMIYVDIGSVSQINGIEKTEEYFFEDAPSRARRKVKNGDTIISTVRTYLKAVAFITNAPENLIVSTGFAVLRPTANMDSSYLYRLAQSDEFVSRVEANSVGVSYPAIAPAKLGRFEIGIPPLEEQRKISAYLNDETIRIDALVAKIKAAIKKLLEYRSSLISAAVTGKIDVSGEIPA